MIRVVAKALFEDVEGVLAEGRGSITDRIGAAGHGESGSFHPHGTVFTMGRFPEVVAVLQLWIPSYRGRVLNSMGGHSDGLQRRMHI